MKHFHLKIAAGLLLLAATVGCPKADPAVLASVDGEVITQADFESQLRVLKSVRSGQIVDQALREQLLDQLIRQKLLVLEAKKRGLDKNPSLLQAIQEQRQRLKLELEQQMENAKAQMAQLDQAVETKALIDALVAEKKAVSQPSADEIKKYYESQQAKGQSLPPLNSVKGQIVQQIVLDGLVREVRDRYEIKIDQERILKYESPLD